MDRSKSNPIMWVILGVAALLVYAMYQRPAADPAGTPTAAPGVASPGGSTGEPVSAGDRGGIPEWVLLYPGSKPFQVSTFAPPQERYTDFRFRTGDSCRQVIDFYTQKLEQQGFSMHAFQDSSSPFGCAQMVRATSADSARDVDISTTRQGDGVEAGIRVIERKSSTSGSAPDPLTFFEWIPMPPGSSPSGIRPEKTATESTLQFQITSKDDFRSVIGFYEEAFPRLRFTVTAVKKGDQNGMVQAENVAVKRSVTVNVASSGRGSQLSISAIQRK